MAPEVLTDHAPAVERPRSHIAALGLSAVAAAVFLVVPLLTWFRYNAHGNVIYLFGDPPPSPKLISPHLGIRGLTTGPGQWVFGAGIGLAALCLLGIVLPKVRRLGWFGLVVTLPGLVAAGAVGHWYREVKGVPSGSAGLSLVALAGVALTTLSVGCWMPGRSRRTRVSISCGAAIATILTCGIASLVGQEGTAVFLVFDHFFGAP